MLPLGVRQEFFAGQMFSVQAHAYEEAARRVGDPVNVMVEGEAGHFVFIDPGSAMWPKVVASVRSVLGISR